MKLGEFVQCLMPAMKLYISITTWLDNKGNRLWNGPLTDAQMLAYWDCEVIKTHSDAEGKVYCIIYKRAGGVTDETHATITEPEGS